METLAIFLIGIILRVASKEIDTANNIMQKAWLKHADNWIKKLNKD